jgi:hypothetical protein
LKLESVGIRRPASDPDSYDVEESHRGLFVAIEGGAGCADGAAGPRRKWESTRERAILV